MYNTKVGLRILIIFYVVSVIISTPYIHLCFLVAAQIRINKFLVGLVGILLGLNAICIEIILDRDIKCVMFFDCLILEVFKGLLTSLRICGLFGNVRLVLELCFGWKERLTVDRELAFELIRVAVVLVRASLHVRHFINISQIE